MIPLLQVAYIYLVSLTLICTYEYNQMITLEWLYRLEIIFKVKWCQKIYVIVTIPCANHKPFHSLSFSVLKCFSLNILCFDFLVDILCLILFEIWSEIRGFGDLSSKLCLILLSRDFSGGWIQIQECNLNNIK